MKAPFAGRSRQAASSADDGSRKEWRYLGELEAAVETPKRIAGHRFPSVE